MNQLRNICLVVLLLFAGSFTQPTNLFYTTSGRINFRSEAPQELIKASSEHLQGIIDPSKKIFVFKVTMRTFHGFNSPLQQEHFNEKYLETDKYPESIFIGKIIEDINFDQDGTYEIRAKGKLTVHGVEMERIIKSNLIMRNGTAEVSSNFTIMLANHNIKVPKIVHEKIASEIKVEIKATFKKKN